MSAHTAHAAAADAIRAVELRRSRLSSAIVRRMLSGRADDGFDGLHDGRLGLLQAESLDLIGGRGEQLGIDKGIVALAVIIAADPDCDIPRIRDLEEDVLIAGNFGDVDRDL
jgi:hypothetical protein